ncbi:acetyltransferase [Akkermansiaceae bacterium]|nr:acetyltransferase [Akkermansiaceae bacterium]
MVELVESLAIPIIGLIDKHSPVNTCCKKYPLLGDDEWLLSVAKGGEHVVITPDLPQLRKRLFESCRSAGFETPTIIAGHVSDYAEIGEGSVIQRDAYVSAGSRLGIGVKVNVGVKVMHDVHIADFVTIAPAAVVLGHVQIGQGVYIGANATLLPHVEVGEGAVIGAGAVVTKNVASHVTVKGVPAK